ncbi:MAG: zinc ribbon domain-containing protein [Lachnospiraceae bacterium]|nr:zinc ribbon domain-containing protein [Lachnospiraceae bacterium]
MSKLVSIIAEIEYEMIWADVEAAYSAGKLSETAQTAFARILSTEPEKKELGEWVFPLVLSLEAVAAGNITDVELKRKLIGFYGNDYIQNMLLSQNGIYTFGNNSAKDIECNDIIRTAMRSDRWIDFLTFILCAAFEAGKRRVDIGRIESYALSGLEERIAACEEFEEKTYGFCQKNFWIENCVSDVKGKKHEEITILDTYIKYNISCVSILNKEFFINMAERAKRENGTLSAQYMVNNLARIVNYFFGNTYSNKYEWIISNVFYFDPVIRNAKDIPNAFFKQPVPSDEGYITGVFKEDITFVRQIIAFVLSILNVIEMQQRNEDLRNSVLEKLNRIYGEKMEKVDVVNQNEPIIFKRPVSGTKYCSHCGKEILADANFCSHCGGAAEAEYSSNAGYSRNVGYSGSTRQTFGTTAKGSDNAKKLMIWMSVLLCINLIPMFISDDGDFLSMFIFLFSIVVGLGNLEIYYYMESGELIYIMFEMTLQFIASIIAIKALKSSKKYLYDQTYRKRALDNCKVASISMLIVQASVILSFPFEHMYYIDSYKGIILNESELKRFSILYMLFMIVPIFIVKKLKTMESSGE